MADSILDEVIHLFEDWWHLLNFKVLQFFLPRRETSVVSSKRVLNDLILGAIFLWHLMTWWVNFLIRIYFMRNAWLHTFISLLFHPCLRGPIMLLKKSMPHYTLPSISHIIGSRRQGWYKSGMRVYNQTFLIFYLGLIFL
jgi:hypothetical protein